MATGFFILSYSEFTHTGNGQHHAAMTADTGPMFSSEVTASDALHRFRNAGAADARLHPLSVEQVRSQRARRMSVSK